jgi:hypothetical protein
MPEGLNSGDSPLIWPSIEMAAQTGVPSDRNALLQTRTSGRAGNDSGTCAADRASCFGLQRKREVSAVRSVPPGIRYSEDTTFRRFSFWN